MKQIRLIFISFLFFSYQSFADNFNKIDAHYLIAAKHFGSITGVDDPEGKKPTRFPFTLVIDLNESELVLKKELSDSDLSKLSLLEVVDKHISVFEIISDLKISEDLINPNIVKHNFLIITYLFPVNKFLQEATGNELAKLTELAKDPNFKIVTVDVELQ